MREKRWDLDLPFGLLGEKVVEAILLSQKCTVEVKRDAMVSETGNVAIEYECNGASSGIAATEADWYALILAGAKYNDEIIVFMRTHRLKAIAKQHFTRRCQGGDGKRAKMILVPVTQLLQQIEPLKEIRNE